MRVVILTLTAALMAVPAMAQQPGVPAPEAVAAAPQETAATGTPNLDPRVNQLIIYGDDPCPVSTNDEIIVCARLPEDDRYRVPSNMRDNPNAPAVESWANRASELSYTGATGIGSCSTAGPGGMIGCFNQIVNQARAERREGDATFSTMIQEAREARMRQIDEQEAQDAEAEQNQPQ
jgi:hypothetical protein